MKQVAPLQKDLQSALVGPNEHAFAVHKDVICTKSEFFRAACSTRWLEGREKVVRLPGVEPENFRVYIDWAYTNAVVLEAASTSSTPPKRTSCRAIVDIYLLGDVLGDVKLGNQAMQLLSTHVQPPNGRTIRHIRDHTPTNSLLRKWAVDVSILTLSRDYFVRNAATFPAEFVLGIATALLQQQKPVNLAEVKTKLSSPECLEPEGGDNNQKFEGN